MDKKTILHINMLDYKGGAARIAYNLHTAFKGRGIKSFMAVGNRSINNDASILSIHKGNIVSYMLYLLMEWGFSLVADRVFGLRLVSSYLRILLEKYKRGSKRIASLIVDSPDIIHAHNLHRNYFSLYSLPYLSRNFPFVYTLHDTWSFTGHCAYYLDCYRWESGCGKCPYLSLYPLMGVDQTAYYLKLKQDIYTKSSFYLVTPSKWLMDSARRSILKPAIRRTRVIPNGINLNTFYPAKDDGVKEALRACLGFSRDDIIVSFVAQGAQRNPFKDYDTVRSAVSMLSKDISQVVFLAIGGDRTYLEEGENGENIHHIKYESDPDTLADYYRISDIYVHGARAEVFGLVIAEALACGVPCVGTSVGGIPEIINGLSGVVGEDSSNTHSIDTATGVLTPLGDASSMASAIEYLIKNADIRKRLSTNASIDAKARFSEELCTARYLEFYKEAELDFIKKK